MSYSGGTKLFYVPNPISWADTAVVAPASAMAVQRVGATLYGFGGQVSGTSTANIYSATFDATGTVPVFTSTGATLPAVTHGARVAILGSTLYAFGDRGGDNLQGIWSAPLSTPTVWTNTSATVGETRENAPLVIVNGLIMLIKGYTGSAGLSTYRYTSTSTPTTGWANTSAYGALAWECAACVSAGCLVTLGGINETTTLRRQAASLVTTATPLSSTTFPGTSQKACDMTHIGRELIVFGDSTSNVYSVDPGNELAAWRTYTGVLPVSPSYIYSNWIGGDGRAYFINPSNQHIIRSDRQAVYVSASVYMNRANPYQGMAGTYADGSPAYVSSHVLTSSAPWLNNLSVAF